VEPIPVDRPDITLYISQQFENRFQLRFSRMNSIKGFDRAIETKEEATKILLPRISLIISSHI
jgi:hypothetical protein